MPKNNSKHRVFKKGFKKQPKMNTDPWQVGQGGGGDKMRKSAKVTFFTFLGVLLFAGFVGATTLNTFDSLGWVNPNYGDSWNAPELTGKAEYTFQILENYPVNTVHLYFESDIFDTSALVNNPTGWSVTGGPSGWSFTFAQNSNQSGFWLTGSAGTNGTILGAFTSPLSFTVDYKLLDESRYRFGSGTNPDGTTWNWNESQGAGPWDQKYSLSFSYVEISKIPKWENNILTWVEESHMVKTYDSPGSTAPIPEPATAVLLSAGILGLIYLNRHKKRRQN